MPDTDRRSGAPLSATEADRLSERFTASWDQPAPWGEESPEQPTVKAPPVSASPPAPSAPPSTGAAPAKPKLQTLLGISPIVVISSPPAAPPPAAAPPPSTSTTPTVPQRPSPPKSAAAAARSSLVSSVAPAPISSPDPSSVARGLTTPSKPYIPKDDPSTPAVVISEAALADAKRKADRARIAQTLPAQTRTAPLLAPVPTPPRSSPVTARVEDVYLPKPRRAWPLVLGGSLAVALGVGAVVLPGGASEKRASTGAPAAPAVAVPAAAPVAVVPAEVTRPVEPAEPVTSNVEAVARADAKAPAVERRRKPLKKPTTSAVSATPRKSTSKSANESTSSAAPRAAKGVIVRETPF